MNSNVKRYVDKARLARKFEPMLQRVNLRYSTVVNDYVPGIKIVVQKNGHFYDRIVDRACSEDITIKNVEYLVNRLVNEHLCELLFLKTVYPNKQFACYKCVTGGNIAVGFTMPPSSELIISLRTFIRDHRLTTTDSILIEIK